nr:hypothetical protein [Tanacetum cinerariifolium]
MFVDVTKSSVEYTEDNSNDEDNEDNHSTEEEQNTKDSEYVKTPPVKKCGRLKKIVRANENKSSSVKRQGHPRKSNDELKRQTIGSKRKGREYKVDDDDDDNNGTKKMKKKSKIFDENNKNSKILPRTTPTILFNAMAILNGDRKKCLHEMGFGSMIGMGIYELSGKLALYLHSTRCDDFDVTRKKQAIKNWKSVHMQYREKLEIEKYGGFGVLPKHEPLNLQSEKLNKLVKKFEKDFNKKDLVRNDENDDTTGTTKDRNDLLHSDSKMESDSLASDDDNQKSDDDDDDDGKQDVVMDEIDEQNKEDVCKEARSIRENKCVEIRLTFKRRARRKKSAMDNENKDAEAVELSSSIKRCGHPMKHSYHLDFKDVNEPIAKKINNEDQDAEETPFEFVDGKDEQIVHNADTSKNVNEKCTAEENTNVEQAETQFETTEIINECHIDVDCSKNENETSLDVHYEVINTWSDVLNTIEKDKKDDDKTARKYCFKTKFLQANFLGKNVDANMKVKNFKKKLKQAVNYDTALMKLQQIQFHFYVICFDLHFGSFVLIENNCVENDSADKYLGIPKALKRKKCLYEMGFGSMIGMAIHELPGMLGFYVIDNLDTETNVLSLTDNSILITSQSVHDILRIPMGGSSLESLASRSPDDPFIKEWFSQFGEKNEVRPNNITNVIVSTKDAEKCYNTHQDLIYVREKLDEGLSRFPDCKKLNKFREKFEENTTGIDNDDTTGIDKESDSPDCQMKSNSHASDDDNKKSDFQVLFHKESGNSDLQSMKNKERNDADLDSTFVNTSLDNNDNVKESVTNFEVGDTSHATGLYSATEEDESTEHEYVHHILNEDDKVDDSCPTTRVCSVIKGDEVKLTEVEDVGKEKQQIGNEDDRVVDDSDTTIPDSVTEGKGVKFIKNDNVLVDDVPNEMIKCSFKEQKNVRCSIPDLDDAKLDVYNGPDLRSLYLYLFVDVKKLVSDVEKIVADTLFVMIGSK